MCNSILNVTSKLLCINVVGIVSTIVFYHYYYTDATDTGLQTSKGNYIWSTNWIFRVRLERHIDLKAIIGIFKDEYSVI